ncbi:MAG: hypothetical protein FJX54_10605 [Alphaproteobacteria bacterium]|nr:hypothetical protein [Alphaproteobacteria bacterium]
MRIPTVLVLSALVLATTGCSGMTNQQQRALSGGAIGAAGGAIVGSLTGSWLTGAVIGGAGGAAVGALTR